MTVNQISYMRALEDQRHNQVTEAEAYRSNRAREDENYRSNISRESETNRSNLARETETVRSNLAHETETKRSNMAKEYETHRANVESETVKRLLANEQVGEIRSAAALNNARTEAQDLANFITRARDLYDLNALVEYGLEHGSALNPVYLMGNANETAGRLVNRGMIGDAMKMLPSIIAGG